MQTESQTLDHLLRDAAHEELQVQKEYQLLLNNREFLQQELHNKLTTLESIRNEMRIDVAFLKKSSEVYQDKVAEISHLTKTLQQMQAVTRQLEGKRDRLNALEYIMHRTFEATILEQQKTVTLVHEFSIPRNVHRWDAIGAVDPAQVKSLQYRCGLTGKIDRAHRALIELRAERDKLRKECAEMKHLYESKRSAEFVRTAIATYKSDLKRLDREIQELDHQRRSNAPVNSTEKKKVAGARSSLCERRYLSTLTKAANTELAKPEGEPVYYFTESPLLNPMRGGGFTLKQTPHTRKSVPAASMKVGPTPRSRSNLRSKITLVGTDPGLNSHPNAPYLGRNLLLPSMD
jgi:hypothetical protein